MPCEIAEVGIHGVDMDMEQPGDRGGGEVGGPEQEHFRTTTLPRSQRLLKPLVDPAEFGRARFSGHSEGVTWLDLRWVRLQPF